MSAITLVQEGASATLIEKLRTVYSTVCAHLCQLLVPIVSRRHVFDPSFVDLLSPECREHDVGKLMSIDGFGD
jgi:hypothetical protein